MVIDEKQLIAQCQKGDLEKFGLLYDKYIKKIYDFIYYKTTHQETAEDLTSQTFFKAMDKIGGFDCSKGTFPAWLYRIARNTVIDFYRTRRKEANIDDVWDLSGNEDLERDIDSKEKLAQVEKYLAKLKGEQRDIIIMRVWQSMPYKEIAAAMGKSEASCKMVFSRTIRTLRKEMPLALFIFLFLNY
jgi:RNA polymerase sigma-70 factor (ECF subfamily)